MKRKLLLCFTLIFLVVLVFSNDSKIFKMLLESSEKLRTISCFIHMGDVERKSDVAFKFSYEREGGKMRIDYTYPKGMKGSKIAVDGEYFYMRFATLNKTMKKKLEKGKQNPPGSEMGSFFLYTTGDIDGLSSYSVKFIEDEKLNMEWDGVKFDSLTHHFILEKGKRKEEIWVDVKSLIPVKIKIYLNGKPKLEIEVFNVVLNEDIPDEFFRLN